MNKRKILLILAILGFLDRVTATMIGSADEGLIAGFIILANPILGMLFYFVIVLWPLWAILYWWYGRKEDKQISKDEKPFN